MKYYSKVLMFVIVLSLIISAGAVGCQKTEKKTDPTAPGSTLSDAKGKTSSSGETDLLNPVGTFPIAKTKTKLSLLMAQDVLVEDYETNAFTKWVEDRCNADLDFVLLPAMDAKDKLAIMISSNQTLPDVVNMPLDIITTYKYGSGGAFIPLNDFYENQSFYVKQQLDKYPEIDIIRFAKAADGKLYSIPQYIKELHSEVKQKLWINTKWLDKISMKMPATTDEFYKVLKAFKESDPNNNGKADEYPLVGGTGDSQDPSIFLMNSFVYDDADNRFLVKDGKLSVAYATDAWREGLRYMNKLCTEKLLDPISFTQDNSQLRAMANNPDDCIVGSFAFTSITLLPVATSPYINDFEGLPPLEGPAGVRFASYSPAAVLNRWFVTRDCKNPELAFRVGDSLFNEEAFIKARYGVENQDWSAPKQGDISYYDEFGYKPMFVQDNNIWSSSQNSHWRNNIPAFTVNVLQGGVWKDRDPLYYSRRIALTVGKYHEYKPEPGTFVPLLNLNEDEINQVSEIQATLKTYVNECKTRFIMGDMSIEKDWNSYLAEIKRIGLDKFLEVCQAAYDRMYK
ncbi:MAG TPA: extracellular solute-binding protein [Clostridiales bacterium]|nr:extracellular solute-binding protein [Clostridiales bacterium]